MKKLKLSEIAASLNGNITADCTFEGVYTDSRKPVKGGLFIALEGERFDGHDFIKNAGADGAAAVLCRKEADTHLPVIYVEDTKKALLALASYYRSLFDVKIITAWTTDFLLPSSAPGAFIILGCLMAFMNYLNIRKAVKSGKVYVPPAGLDCRHCNICSLNKETQEK